MSLLGASTQIDYMNHRLNYEIQRRMEEAEKERRIREMKEDSFFERYGHAVKITTDMKGKVQKVEKYEPQILDDKPKKKENIMDTLTGWFKKHSDTIITITVIFAVDHFAFNGKFRKKLEQIFDSVVDKVSTKVANTNLEA